MVRRICICTKCNRKFIGQSVDLDSSNVICISCQLLIGSNITTSQCLGAAKSALESLDDGPEKDECPPCVSMTSTIQGESDRNHDTQTGSPPSKRPKTESSVNEPGLPIVGFIGDDNQNEFKVDEDENDEWKQSSAPVVSHLHDNMTSEVVELLDDSTNDGSEAMDDFHCTYMKDDNDDEVEEGDGTEIEENDQQHQVNPPINELEDGAVLADDKLNDTSPSENDELTKPQESSKQMPFSIGNDKICFICGASLANIKNGLKGRINHIKRCSKRNGVTGREVKLNDDDEDFVDTAPPSKMLPDDLSNPYSKQSSSSWHGGTTTEKLLDTNSVLPSVSTSVKGIAKDQLQPQHQQKPVHHHQSTMQNFFQRSSRSVNAVLMAGARRLAASAKIVASAKSTSSSKIPESSFSAAKNRRFGKRSWTPDYSKSSCPNYKKITGTDFVCDGFLYAKSSLTKNYFLTHFHSDHYGGITKSWNAGVIFCSLPTATLVSGRLGVDKQYLHPLPLLTPTVIESNGRPVTVTLMDANHCPGAVMFLFEVGSRRILHVGDFRWNRDVMMQFAPIRELSAQRQRLDELFLDTTYCDEKYSLPTQEDAIRATVEVAEREFNIAQQGGKRALLLFGAYTIGKERIYFSVAQRLKLKIYVDTQRYKILSSLNWTEEQMSLLTTVKSETCLWVVPLGHINMKQLSSYLGNGKSSNQFEKIVGFRPTGWSLSMRFNGIVSSRSNGNLTIHSVPYSEHSSFPELVDCVQCLNPKKIVPTVSVSKSQQQLDLIARALKQKQAKLC